jgi:hypothetical protein
LDTNSTFSVAVFPAGIGVGDSLAVQGAVALNNASLSVVGLFSSTAVAGTSFRIIDNDGTDPVSGTFAGLPEGATVVAQAVGGNQAQFYRITYAGGSNSNDVVLTLIATTTQNLEVAPTTPDKEQTMAPDAASSQPLTDQPLALIVKEAITRWRAAGYVIESQPEVHVADLPGSILGTASSGHIWVDQDAAGHGWFIDSSVTDDLEFGDALAEHELRASDESPASDKVDLLTVVAHELGHLLGFEHSHSHTLMHETLEPGVRYVPESGTQLAIIEDSFPTGMINPSPRHGQAVSMKVGGTSELLVHCHSLWVEGHADSEKDRFESAGAADALWADDADELMPGVSGRDALISDIASHRAVPNASENVARLMQYEAQDAAISEMLAMDACDTRGSYRASERAVVRCAVPAIRSPAFTKP